MHEEDYGIGIIDGENDFLYSGNEPDDWGIPPGGKKQGALCVTGADEEALIVADMIDQINFGGLIPTLDAHHLNDCAHNVSWRDEYGNDPAIYTIVSHEDVVNHRYVPRFAFGVFNGKKISSYDWALKYTKALSDRGRNPLCLWPPHCLIQTWGSCVYHPLQESYNRWACRTGRWVDFVTKGQYPFTEHYSAIIADVEDGTRPETQMNLSVIHSVSRFKKFVWVGWAGSHCLKWTALDAINKFEPTKEQAAQGSKNEFITNSIFIEDACAAVANQPGGPDFAGWRLQFLDEVNRRGATIMKAAEFIRHVKTTTTA